jgi:hypothetical protein
LGATIALPDSTYAVKFRFSLDSFSKLQRGKLQMSDSVFIETDFFALIIFSILVPVGIYFYMMWKKSISRTVVLLLGIILIVTSAMDVFLLQSLPAMAKVTTSLFDENRTLCRILPHASPFCGYGRESDLS